MSGIVCEFVCVGFVMCGRVYIWVCVSIHVWVL